MRSLYLALSLSGCLASAQPVSLTLSVWTRGPTPAARDRAGLVLVTGDAICTDPAPRTPSAPGDI